MHPLRVMLACQGEATQIVAVLHDVIEDSDWTADALRAEGADAGTLAALDSVTRREGETCSAFIERTAGNEIGRAVKIADLRDNMDLSHIANPGEADFARMKRYRAALMRLGVLLSAPTWQLYLSNCLSGPFLSRFA